MDIRGNAERAPARAAAVAEEGDLEAGGARLGLLIGRHEVLLAVALALRPIVIHGDGGLMAWSAGFVLIQAAAAVIAGLVWLFFTKISKGKVLKNFMVISWFLTALLLLGDWS